MIRSSTHLRIGLVCIYLSLVPHGIRLVDDPHGDVRLYFRTVVNLYSGVIPYHLERPFEYPPYATLCFLAPGIATSLSDFRFLFALQLLVFDFTFKLWLLNQGLKSGEVFKSLIPLVAYSIGTGFLSSLYFQRLDLVPALLTLLAIQLACNKKPGYAGALLGLGAGTKLFPILLVPLLFAVASDRRDRLALVGGVLISLLPIIVMSPWLAWWRFLEFHDRRGFEVESIYASVFWFVNFFVDLDLSWSWVIQWREVTGRHIAWLLSYAKATCFVTTITSALWIARIAWLRRREKYDVSDCSSMSLVVLLPFVGFNIVLSPQYLVWLLVLAVVGLLEAGCTTAGNGFRTKRSKALVFIVVASMLTPIWYPSPEFSHGFTLFQTFVLLVRNCMLISSWVMLILHYGGRSLSVLSNADLGSDIEHLGSGDAVFRVSEDS